MELLGPLSSHLVNINLLFQVHQNIQRHGASNDIYLLDICINRFIREAEAYRKEGLALLSKDLEILARY